MYGLANNLFMSRIIPVSSAADAVVPVSSAADAETRAADGLPGGATGGPPG
jgi:hypothetical protein